MGIKSSEQSLALAVSFQVFTVALFFTVIYAQVCVCVCVNTCSLMLQYYIILLLMLLYYMNYCDSHPTWSRWKRRRCWQYWAFQAVSGLYLIQSLCQLQEVLPVVPFHRWRDGGLGARQLTQRHTASKQQSRNLNSLLTPKASAFLPCLCLLGEEELSLDFPGGPVVKNLCFHCRRVDSIPDRGCSACQVVKPKKKKKEKPKLWVLWLGLPLWLNW